MKKYSLYLFDFDGTLFDTFDSLKEIYRISLAKFNKYPTEENYSKFLGLSLPRCRKYMGIEDKYEKEFCDYFNKIVLSDEVVKKTKLYFDTLDLFNYLNKNNVPYGIVTGSAKKRVLDVLKFFKIDSTKILTIIGNESYKHPKPDKEPIVNALKSINYHDNLKEVLYIGDGEQDELCANSAGVDFIKVKREDNDGTLPSLLDLFK